MSFLLNSFQSDTNNSINIGTDLISLTIVDQTTGASVVLDGRKDMFTSTAADELVKSSPFDNGGLPDHRVVADGWTGSLRVDRKNGSFGAYYALLEQNFFANGVQHYCTMTSTIQSSDGTSTERMQYQNVVFHGYKPGDFEKKSITKPEVSFAAQQRVPV